jgi:hypothetical protein
MCYYDKILVNVAAYVIPGLVCVWRRVNMNRVHMLVHNKHLTFNMHAMNIKERTFCLKIDHN